MRAAGMRNLAVAALLALSPLAVAGAPSAGAGNSGQQWSVTIEPAGEASFTTTTFEAPEGLCGSSIFDSGKRKAKVCFGPINGVQTATGWVLNPVDESVLDHFAVEYEGSTVRFTRPGYQVTIIKT